MKRLFSFAFILCLLAGILTACSDSSNGFRRHRDINKEVLVFFNDDITPQEAREYIKDNDAYIIQSNEAYDYYLITFATTDDVEDFFFFLDDEDDPYVSFAMRNQYAEPCAVKLTAIDNNTTISEGHEISHGEMVRRTLNQDQDFNPNIIDVYREGKGITYGDITKAVIETCEKMSDKDLNIINISWGPKHRIEVKDEETKKVKEVWKDDDTYIKDYIEELELLATGVSKCNKQNYIITKSMGNHAVHHIEDAFNSPDFYKQMDSKKFQTLREHFIFVAAKDTRPGHDWEYSNRLSDDAKKNRYINTIMVDISKLPSELNGTSAAAPYLANWIAKSKFDKASDVIETVKKTTKERELVSQNSFKEMANKVITNRTINESIPRDGKKPKSSKVAIGGTLRIYAYDDYGKKRLRYETNGLDYTTDKVVFVLESDTSINISPYLTPAEQSLLGGKRQTAFTVRFNNKIFLKKFAEKYAYKRVFVVGTLNAPMASIYTPTDVVINMESITIDDGKIVKMVLRDEMVEDEIKQEGIDPEKDLIGKTIKDPSKDGYFGSNWYWNLKEENIMSVYAISKKDIDQNTIEVTVFACLTRGELEIDATIAMTYEKTRRDSKLNDVRTLDLTIPAQTDYSQYVELKNELDDLEIMKFTATNHSNYDLFLVVDYVKYGKPRHVGFLLEQGQTGVIELPPYGWGTENGVDSYNIRFAYRM